MAWFQTVPLIQMYSSQLFFSMDSRRSFIQKGLLAGAGLGLIPASNLNAQKAPNPPTEISKNGIITLLQTTDIHCQIHPHDEMFWENDQPVFRKTGGYAHLATMIKKIRKENPNTFVMDTGDMYQGSELSVRTQGKALVPILNAINYDLYIPGNWEVVYYKTQMQKLLGALRAPKICANMYHDLGNGQKGELIFQPYHTVSMLGVKVGFLSYTDHLVPKRQSPAYSKGIIYTRAEENLKYYVSVLREQEQCDFVILLSHLGLSQQIALGNHPHCEGVDYIFGGDTHERIRKPIQCKYTKVVEPGAFGSFIGRLDLTIKDGKITDQNYELLEVDPKKHTADAEIAQLIAEHEEPFHENIYKEIGKSTVPLYRYFVVENTMDTMIVDALKWKVKTDIVISNGFRFCPPRVPDKDGMVSITEGYLFDMLPVNSPVRVGEVTGQQIKDWLERELENVFAKDSSRRFGGWLIRFKGMTIEFKAFVPMGEKVQKIEIGGEPLDLNKSYTMCACEREGDPEDVLCRMQGVKNAVTQNYTLHETMKEYLAANSPVTPILRQAAKILDGPQTLLSQVWGLDYEFR